VTNPAEAEGSEKDVLAAFEIAYREIQSHIIDLAEAILGEKTK